MNRPGMTLMEVIVGLAVASVALSAAYAAFGTVVDSNDRARAHAQESARAAAIRHELTGWLRGARLTAEAGGPSFQGLDGVRDGTADDELIFLTMSPTPLGDGEAVVRLFIDRDSTTRERGLTAELVEWRGAARERIEIEPAASGLDLQYLSALPREDHWYPSWISTSLLPRAIRLVLQPSPGDSLPPLLRLPVRVPVGGRS